MIAVTVIRVVRLLFTAALLLHSYSWQDSKPLLCLFTNTVVCFVKPPCRPLFYYFPFYSWYFLSCLPFLLAYFIVSILLGFFFVILPHSEQLLPVFSPVPLPLDPEGASFSGMWCLSFFKIPNMLSLHKGFHLEATDELELYLCICRLMDFSVCFLLLSLSGNEGLRREPWLRQYAVHNIDL